MECSCGHVNGEEAAYCEVCGNKLFRVANPAIICVQCHKEFNLGDSVWCLCETESPTYVCPHCERCACNV